MILVTIKHMGGMKPGATSLPRGRKPRSENGFAPGVNWMLKSTGECLLVETTGNEPDAGEASRFRGFWGGK